MPEVITLQVKYSDGGAEASLKRIEELVKRLNGTTVNIGGRSAGGVGGSGGGGNGGGGVPPSVIGGSGGSSNWRGSIDIGSIFGNAAKQTNVWAQSLHELNNRAQKTGDTIGNLVMKVGKWALATTLIYTPLHAFQDALDTMKQVDAQMVSIQKVTDLTAVQMDELAKHAYDVAAAYGRTADEVLESAAAFARAGYGEQIEQLSELSILTQNIGDINATAADEFILAADAAWKLGGNYNDLMAIIDGMNNVTNKNATDIAKLAEGITIAGSVFANAGEEVSTFTALLGTGTAATQRGGSEIARALRTIVMNIRQIRGETEDGELIDGESIANASKALSEYAGVSTMANGELRKTSDVLADLAGKWDSLDSVAQSAISEALAGKRQSNVLIALMDNWEMYEKMLTEYAEGAGSALAENEIYLDSWEAKTKQLSATVTQFVSNTLNSGFFKGIISAITSIVSSVGSLHNLLIILLPVVAGFNLTKILSLTDKLGDSLKTLWTVVSGLYSVLAKKQTMDEFGASLSAAGNLASLAKVGLVAFGLAMWGIIAAINKAKQAEEERRKAAIEGAEALRTEEESAQELIKTLSNENLSREELNTILADQKKGYEDELIGIEDVNEARKRAIELIKGETEERRKQYINENAAAYYDAQKGLGRSVRVYFGAEIFQGTPRERLAQMEAEMERLREGIANGETWVSSLSMLSAEYSELLAQVEEWELIVGEYEEVESTLTGSTEDGTKAVEDRIKSLMTLTDELEGATNAKKKFDKALEGGNQDDLFKGYADAYKKFREELNAGRTGSNTFWAAAGFLLGDDTLEAFEYDTDRVIKAMKELGGVFGDAESAGAGLLEKMDGIADKNGDIVDANGDIIASIDKVNGAWEWNIENADALAEKLGMDVDALWACIHALEVFGDVKAYDIDELIKEMEALGISVGRVDGEVTSVDWTKIESTLKSMGVSAQQIYKLKQSLNEAGIELQETSAEASDLDGWFSKVGGSIDSINKTSMSGMRRELDATTETAKKLYSVILSIRSLLNGSPTNGSIGGGLSGFASGTNGAPGGAALVNEAGAEIIATEDGAFIAGGGMPTITNVPKGATVYTAEQTRKILGRNFGNIVFPAFVSGTTPIGSGGGGGGSVGGQNAWEELEEYMERVLDEAKDALDEQIKTIDEQIDALKKEREELKEKNELEEKQLAILKAEQDLLDAQNERTVRIYNSSTGQWEWIADQRAVNDAQKALDDAKKELSDYLDEQAYQEALEALQQQKDLLNEQYDALEEQWQDILDSVQEPTREIGEILADIASGSIQRFREAVDEVTALLERVAATEEYAASASFGAGLSGFAPLSSVGIISGTARRTPGASYAHSATQITNNNGACYYFGDIKLDARQSAIMSETLSVLGLFANEGR